MLRLIAMLALLALAMVGVAPPAPADDWSVERVVMLMRHGVRSPNAQPPLPATVAPEPWPGWAVLPGRLTGHGAAAIRLVAAADARRFAAEGVLPGTGCPPPGATVLVADSLERTIATGDNYLSAFAPHCTLTTQHAQQGVPTRYSARTTTQGSAPLRHNRQSTMPSGRRGSAASTSRPAPS